MSITGELRGFASNWDWLDRGASANEREILAIADRIDEAHERKVEEMTSSWDYWEYTHVELPKDADGEPIHIGDVMECDKLPNGSRVCGEVKAISNDCVWLINVQYKIHAKYLRHYHKPTIEDVLAEFALEIDSSADIAVTGAETIKKFAAKLQLKEED